MSCPARTSDGAYAQCDGGMCFTSTEGQSFPGFAQPLTKDQIICFCPITIAHPKTAKLGYQISGPYPCQKSFFENRKKVTATAKTGSMIYVGAPTGTARLLTFLLTGNNPKTNECPSRAIERDTGSCFGTIERARLDVLGPSGRR